MGNRQVKFHFLASAQEKMQWRLREEAWLLLKLRCASVPRVFLRFGPLLCAGSLWMPGKTLRQRMAAGISNPEALRILALAARELDWLGSHDPALWHGDLSPENLLVAGEDQVHWIDWDSVEFDDPYERPRERFFAKPAYLAPERAMNGTITLESEIFALGAMAFEQVVGRALFPNTVLGMHESMGFGKEAWLSACSQIPKQYRSGIAKSIHPSVGGRYGSFGQFAEELARAIAQG